MTNLTASVDIQQRGKNIVYPGVKASTTLYKGALLEYNGGYVQQWNPSDGYPFAGIAESSVIIPIVPTSAGASAFVVGASDGWTQIPVARAGLFRFPYSAAAVTNIGSLAYASEDHTIVLVSNGAPIGIVVDYESGYLWIDITGYTVPAETAINTFTDDISLATGTGTTGVAMRIGTTGSPVVLNTVGQRGIQEYYSTTATSDTTYGRYTQLKVLGAGVEGDCHTLPVIGKHCWYRKRSWPPCNSRAGRISWQCNRSRDRPAGEPRPTRTGPAKRRDLLWCNGGNLQQRQCRYLGCH